MKFDIKKKIIFIILFGTFLTVVTWLKEKSVSNDNYVIKRPEPGEESEYEMIEVYDEEGTLLSNIKAVIEPKKLSQKQVEEYFEKAFVEIRESMLKDNSSTDKVSSDLNLMETCQNRVIKCDWYSDNYTVINYDGKVNNQDFEKTQKEIVNLRLILSYDDLSREYIIPVTVVAPELDQKSWDINNIEKSVKKAINDNPDEDIVLPREVDGNTLSYGLGEENTNPLVFAGLSIIAAIFVIYADKNDKKKKERDRKNNLTLDYSEVVSKLTLLIGAGMSTRKAWNKIVQDYETQKKQGIVKERYVYEEMLQTEYSMRSGISEVTAYEMFGRRCDTKEYLKLASLLQTNIKKGTKELRKLLEEEAENAFEQRKQMASIKGEEATTKLLLPMLLMLVVVMVIIMVPAMMKFYV